MSDDTHWTERAECVRLKRRGEITLDAFFFEGQFQPNSTKFRERVEMLRNICAECLVFDECREYADRLDIREGFWAGETSSERHDRRFPNHKCGYDRRPRSEKKKRVALL